MDFHPTYRFSKALCTWDGSDVRRQEGSRRQGRWAGVDGSAWHAGPPGFTITAEICNAYRQCPAISGSFS